MCKMILMVKLLRVLRSAMLTVSLFLAAVSLQAFQTPQAPAAEDKAAGEKCSIEGRVLNGATGQPLGRAALTLIPDVAANRVTAQSGEDGRFSFVGVIAGRYTLSADRAGYLRQYYGAGGVSASRTYLPLTLGQQLKDVVFKLVPAAVISGRALGEDDEPIPGMLVSALRASYQRGVRGWTRVAAAIPNDKGEFRLTGLAAGEYLVATYNGNQSDGSPSAQPPGDKPEREYVATFFPSATDEAGAVPVRVAAGTEAGGTEVRLRKTNTVRIRGKVIGMPEGRGVMARLSPKGVTDTTMASIRGEQAVVSKQKDGSFEIKGVVPGAYLLSASYTLPPMSVFIAALPLQVGERHIEGLVLRPAAAIELAGAVVTADKTSTQLGGVQIRLEPVEYHNYGPYAKTSEDGRFAVTNVEPGRYRVQVSNLPAGSYVRSLRYGTQEAAEEVIDLTSGVLGSLQATLSLAGAQVDGVVHGKDDKPVSGATVALVPASQRYTLFKESRTSENGSFSINGIAPGEYKILAWEDIEAGAYQDPEVLKRYESKAEKLSLKDSDRKTVSLKAIPIQQP